MGGGFRLGSDLNCLIKDYCTSGFVGVEVPQFGANARWTKMDCFVGLSDDMDRDMRLPQIQATFSLWRNTAKVRRFIDEWARACCDPVLVSDQPSLLRNHWSFIAHRHDQSILTLLARRYGMPVLRPIRSWEAPLFYRLRRSYEANAGFKQVSFVYRCLKCGAALPVFLVAYLRRKSALFNLG